MYFYCICLERDLTKDQLFNCLGFFCTHINISSQRLFFIVVVVLFVFCFIWKIRCLYIHTNRHIYIYKYVLKYIYILSYVYILILYHIWKDICFLYAIHILMQKIDKCFSFGSKKHFMRGQTFIMLVILLQIWRWIAEFAEYSSWNCHCTNMFILIA